jgi:hypothetical protein
MKIIDAARFEQTLISEYDFQRRVYNEMYAGKWTSGKDLISAKVLETKVEILGTIIEALQKSIVEGGY